MTRSESINLNSNSLDFSASFGTSRDRRITAEQLMRMKPHEQLIYVKGVGWIICNKVGQHQIAPFCHGELADNPLEGPQRTADPKVTIPIKKVQP